jgi:hypothetical protein
MVILSLDLETAFLASMLSSIVVLIGFILIKFLARDLKGITFWIFAYACGFLEYVSLYLLTGQGQLFFEFLFEIYYGAFLLIGMILFFDLKISYKFWGIFLALIVVLDILIVFVVNNYSVFLYINSFLSGSLLIYLAIKVFQFSKSVDHKEDLVILVFIGVSFLLDGLHMYDYPFLRPIESFAPIGYMIGFSLAQTMSFGLFILIFQKINHMNMKSIEMITQLEGLLPICASCKKIRDVQGYWSQLEEYFLEHSEIKFTHSLCDDCISKLYPDMDYSTRRNTS